MNQRDRVAAYTDAGGDLAFLRVADRVHVVRPELPGEELGGVPMSPEGGRSRHRSPRPWPTG
jgi:hypothetical protein